MYKHLQGAALPAVPFHRRTPHPTAVFHPTGMRGVDKQQPWTRKYSTEEAPHLSDNSGRTPNCSSSPVPNPTQACAAVGDIRQELPTAITRQRLNSPHPSETQLAASLIPPPAKLAARNSSRWLQNSGVQQDTYRNRYFRRRAARRSSSSVTVVRT
ncbi:MAG: hypothetical protein Q4A92_10900 [Corynebacterium sp.]|nr:hypothetical protein [Corynebacterium sp.]